MDEIKEDKIRKRGKCLELSQAFVDKNPSYELIRGWYHCPVWGQMPHWWTKDSKGEIHDPTACQFPSRGVGFYEEYKGFVKCEQCGKEISESEIHNPGDSVILCSYACYGRMVGF